MDVDVIVIAFMAGFALVCSLGFMWFSRPVYSDNFFWTVLGISAALFFFFGSPEIDYVIGDPAFMFGQGVGLTLGSLIIGYVLSLILFGLGRLLGFIEKAAGVKDKEE